MKRTYTYLGVTFGLTWSLWIATILFLGGDGQDPFSQMVLTVVATIGMFFPLVGALAANASMPVSDRIDLCFKPRLKGNLRLYALAWFVPAVLTALGGVVYFLVFPGCFDPSGAMIVEALEASGRPADQPFLVFAGTVASALTIAPLINAIPAFGEEAGWRGMLFPSLCEHMSERNAVLLSGLIWGVWHAPIIAIGHNYGTAYPGYPIMGIMAMVIACTSLGCLLAWLRLRSESVWPCAIAHGAINAAANLGICFSTLGPTLAGPSPLGLVAGIPAAGLAIICWLSLSGEKRP